ncbi:MAG: hypothetical protein RL385_1898 [Pseudomonadota bacterium]
MTLAGHRALYAEGPRGVHGRSMPRSSPVPARRGALRSARRVRAGRPSWPCTAPARPKPRRRGPNVCRGRRAVLRMLSPESFAQLVNPDSMLTGLSTTAPMGFPLLAHHASCGVRVPSGEPCRLQPCGQTSVVTSELPAPSASPLRPAPPAPARHHPSQTAQVRVISRPVRGLKSLRQQSLPRHDQELQLPVRLA